MEIDVFIYIDERTNDISRFDEPGFILELKRRIRDMLTPVECSIRTETMMDIDKQTRVMVK